MSKFSFVSRRARRAIVAPAAAAVMTASLMGGAGVATAAPAKPAPQVEQLSSQLNSIGQQFSIENLTKGSREQAWATRNQLLDDIQRMNPQLERAIRPTVDAVVDFFFPGLRAKKEAEAKAKREAIARANAARDAAERAKAEAAARKAEAERKRNAFNPGPCPRDAKACVDIDGHRTWLQDGRGNVTYVAPAMNTGRPGQDTPRGTFYVTRKVKDEISREFNNAPMPYATYFTWNGHAFHEGNPATQSAGCVRLPQQAAIRYFNDLQIGDKVFIY